MGLSATIKYMLGVLTNHRSIWSMYLCGAGIVTTLRILVVSTGISISILEGSYTGAVNYTNMAIETFFPIFICFERGLASIDEMFNTIIMNTLIGTGFSSLKYGMAT